MSSIPTTTMLCASCATVDASAPRRSPNPAHEPEPDSSRAQVALHDSELRQVAFRVGERLTGALRRLLDEGIGDDLARHEPDHACVAAVPRDAELLGAERADPHGVPHPFRHLGERDLLYRTPVLEHELGFEALEVRQHEHVGLVAGSERAEVPEPMPGGRIERRHHDCILGRDPGLDGAAHHRVDVPFRCDVLRLSVVRAERDPSRPELTDERQQGVEVARTGSLPDQQPHPQPQPFAALLRRHGFVVGADSRSDVRVQVLSDHARRVPVDVRRMVEPQLFELTLVAGDDAGEVHHLGEPDHAPPPQQSLEVSGRQPPARRLELRRRHTR